MNYYQFVMEVKKKIEIIVGDALQIDVASTTKNNGNKRIGLSLRDPEVNIAPTIYLEEFYDSYLDSYSLDEIVYYVLALYEDIRFEQDIDIDDMLNFELIKDRIAFKLINFAMNEDLLEHIPHKCFMEFALVFYVILDTDDDQAGTILITDKILEYWGVGLDELYEAANRNMPTLLPMKFKPMKDMMREIPTCPPEVIVEDNPLYVLTNEASYYGAAALMYDGILPYIARQLHESFYILPSSIHEVIIIPESTSPPQEELDQMIENVNKTQIDPEEQLGNFSYYYDARKKILM